jgi:hypothetical protein
MRLNRLRLISALISVILASLFYTCSRSDVITGAGGSVVKDFDPDLIDLDRGFARITLFDTAVGAAFSLPATPDPLLGIPDPLFGTFIANYFIIGLSDDADTLAAHIQYSMAGDTSYNAEDSLIGAYICFQAVDGDSGASSGGAGSSIKLFPSSPLAGFAPVNRADMNAGEGGADNSLGSFSISGAEICSLQLRDDFADSIFRARASRDTGLHKTFAFSIVDYLGPLIKLNNPYIVVERLRKDCCIDSSWVLSDTIRGAVTRYSSFEDPDSAAKRGREPYSSQFTQRTAVFKVNAGKVLDSLSRMGLSVGGCELLNAVITIRYHNTDSSSSVPILLSRRAGDFKALVLDTLLTKDIDTATDTGEDLLRYRFARDGSGSIKLATPYNTLSFKTALRNVIRKYNSGDTPYVYIYLRAATERSTIWWCKPTLTYPPYPPNIRSITIETVFTPHGVHAQ